MRILAILTFLLLAACVTTQEMPLAPNVVRLDTRASGILFAGRAVPATMVAAAKATLSRGYTHFRFQDAALQQGSAVVGVIGNSNTNVNGTYGGGFMTANANTFGSSSVVRTPTAGAAVTVIMFHSNEPGAQGAFDARQVLAQYGS